uniref:U-box domain-containing protein n=1 Tax=Ananas comosus var. bracteatus TaxID=296719 RepID=A0A6V7Q3Z0_ANACO|nr:unnamed protein product [Ananas comosus var. bracteatus]
MVSLTDTQISASQSQSPCASSVRIQRLLGRSMRTVRSNLFKNAPVRALDPPEPSGAVSEELTDSFVDIRLRELAAAGPSSAAGKAARDLLELSGEFSDYSSFSSDISGELERLAGVVPDRTETGGAGVRGEAAGDGAGGGAAGGGGAAAAAGEAPVGAPGADRGVGGDPCAGGAAAEHGPGGAGGGGDGAAEPVAGGGEQGGDRGGGRDQAAGVRAADGHGGGEAERGVRAAEPVDRGGAPRHHRRLRAIPPLVSLLVRGTTRGKKDALAALYKLCAARRNKERAVSAGAVGPLVAMVAEQQGGTAEKAMVVLGSLAAIADGRDAIVDAGGIPALVEAIEDGPPRGKEFAVVALLQLCADSPATAPCSSARAPSPARRPLPVRLRPRQAQGGGASRLPPRAAARRRGRGGTRLGKITTRWRVSV